jgi:hypothetical protein
VDFRAYVKQAANDFTTLHEKKNEWTTITPRGLGEGISRGLSFGEPLKNNAGLVSNSFAALCEGEAMEDGDFYNDIDLKRIRSLRGQQDKIKKKARSSTKKIATSEGKHHTVSLSDYKHVSTARLLISKEGLGNVITSSRLPEMIPTEQISTDMSIMLETGDRQAVGEGIVEMWFNQDELDCQPVHTEWKVVKTRSIERGVLPASTYASQKISEANGENVARKQERKSAFNLKEGGGGPATYLVSSEDNSTQNYNDINNDVEEEEKEGKSSGEGAVKLEER